MSFEIDKARNALKGEDRNDLLYHVRELKVVGCFSFGDQWLLLLFAGFGLGRSEHQLVFAALCADQRRNSRLEREESPGISQK